MAKFKIQKTNGSIVVDSYANNQTLDSSGNASGAGTHEGGVGGYTSQTIATIQPTVKVRTATATTGSIVAQKGAHKFQVADEATIQDEDIVLGQEYRISSVSGTNWTQFGAGPNANTNDIFTAKIAGSSATVDDGTVQNVGTCTLVNLVTPTAANTMSILCTAANVVNANIANIGANISTNRVTAYLTWNSGDVIGGTNNFKVGQTINLINSNVTGNLTITTINSTTNLTVTTDTTQTVPVGNTTAFTSTFLASKISNKYVWDFLNGGTAESSSTGGFTGATNPNRFRYWFGEPSDTFVKVKSA